MNGTETAQAVSDGSVDIYGTNNIGTSSNRNDRAHSVDIRVAHNVAQRMKDHQYSGATDEYLMETINLYTRYVQTTDSAQNR